MHLAETSSTLFCLWTGLSLPVALHSASQRRSYLQLRTGQCSRPEGTFTLLLVRTFRRTFPRHFVPGYDRCCPYGTRWQRFPQPYPLRRSAETTVGNEFPGRHEPGEVLAFRGEPPADRE
jgi:hypothetical protein